MTSTTYATVDDFKSLVKVTSSIADVDSRIQDLLNTAAQAIDGMTRGYKPGYEAFSTSASEVRYFDDILYEGGYLELDDFQAVSTITRGGQTIQTAYYKFFPYNASNTYEPYTRLYFNAVALPQILMGGLNTWYGWPLSQTGLAQIVITGTWGYCSAGNRPPVIKEATLKLAKQLYDEGAYSARDMMNAVSNPSSWVDKSINMLLMRAGVVRLQPLFA